MNLETIHAALDGKQAQWLTGAHAHRARVPGGWLLLVHVGTPGGMVFYLDPEHGWDGASLPLAPGPGPRRHG